MAFDSMIMRPSTFGQTVTLTEAATVATDASLGTRFLLTLTGAANLGVPTNAKNGDFRIWEVTASGGARTLTLITTAGGFLPMETVEASPAPEIPAALPIPSGETLALGAYYSSSLGLWVPVFAVASI